MSLTPNDDLQLIRPAAHVRPVGWFVRRAVFGLLVLSSFVVGSACLLYASIDPNETAVAEQAEPQSE